MVKKAYFKLVGIQKGDDIGNVMVGLVESGILTVNMQLNVEGSTFKVKQLNGLTEQLTKAETGTIVAISFEDQPIEFLEQFQDTILVFSDDKSIDSTNSKDLNQVTSSSEKSVVSIKISVNKKDWYVMITLEDEEANQVAYFTRKEFPKLKQSILDALQFLEKAKEINSFEKKIDILGHLEIHALKHTSTEFVKLTVFETVILLSPKDSTEFIAQLELIPEKAKKLQEVI